jgi:hypothetical protein
MLEVIGKVVMGCERCNGLIKPEPWMDYGAERALTRERRTGGNVAGSHDFRSVGEDKTYCGARHAWNVTSEREVRQYEREGIHY